MMDLEKEVTIEEVLELVSFNCIKKIRVKKLGLYRMALALVDQINADIERRRYPRIMAITNEMLMMKEKRVGYTWNFKMKMITDIYFI